MARRKLDHITEDDRFTMVKKYVDGSSLSDLSKEFGVSMSTVSRMLREKGVEIRKRGQRASKVNVVSHTSTEEDNQVEAKEETPTFSFGYLNE